VDWLHERQGVIAALESAIQAQALALGTRVEFDFFVEHPLYGGFGSCAGYDERGQRFELCGFIPGDQFVNGDRL